MFHSVYVIHRSSTYENYGIMYKAVVSTLQPVFIIIFYWNAIMFIILQMSIAAFVQQ